MSALAICCHYDGSYTGFLCCVFDCYVNHEEPVEFRPPEDGCCSLYPVRTVESHPEHAKRVYRSLARRLGIPGQRMVTRGFLTCLPEKELWLWRLIQKGYQMGPAFLRDLTDPVVDRVGKAVLHLEHEAHALTGFVRFSLSNGVLVGEIEPKNRVLPLLRPHFSSRYPQESFLLYDRTHQEALFHRPGKWAILPVSDFQMGPADDTELAYRTMWRSFYHTIAIQPRYNPKCRMTHMPKRYWSCMTEFQFDACAETAPPKLAQFQSVPPALHLQPPHRESNA
ncbi:MAG: TIGR03915 family putative DNA repair protein [Lawsonibacter sp.]|jgi:probable DNA metabolism protein